MNFIIDHTLLWILLAVGGALAVVGGVVVGNLVSGFGTMGDPPWPCFVVYLCGAMAFVVGILPCSLLLFRFVVHFTTQ